MGQLEHLLPDQIKERALPSGSELVLCYDDALTAIQVAAEHDIAVLGLEAFEIQQDSLLTVSYTGYDMEPTCFSDWKFFARSHERRSEKMGS